MIVVPSLPSMVAIRAAGLVKSFGAARAIEGVDLVVHDGEVHGLLGPNGAGKTTVLRLLFGLLRADAGSIEVLGRPQSADAPVLDGVAGFVEDPRFYPYLSARANLELLAKLDGTTPAPAVDRLLARVGLLERAGDRVGGFSTGMRQRLGIAAALLRDPRLLLLDEPTAGLDPAGIAEMSALMRELATAGVTILVSSHQIGEVEGTCDGFTVLKRGAVAWSGSKAELRAQAPPSAYTLVTSNDQLAHTMAQTRPGLHVVEARQGGDLVVAADQPTLDAFAVALGQAGVAIRRLDLLVSPLESMYFALTTDATAPVTLVELAERALAAS
jgi:ABC-2 type transport system ATP-binding protein